MFSAIVNLIIVSPFLFFFVSLNILVFEREIRFLIKN